MSEDTVPFKGGYSHPVFNVLVDNVVENEYLIKYPEATAIAFNWYLEGFDNVKIINTFTGEVYNYE